MGTKRRQPSPVARRQAGHSNNGRRTDAQQDFNFSAHAKILCHDIATRIPEFGHLRVDQISFSFVPTRSAAEHGTLATLTPLRFAGGATEAIQDGRRCRVQTVLDANGNEMLYILNFFMPRFMQLAFEQKLVTVFHELLHISPSFDGDLRRFPGRCYMHSTSEKEYDAQAERLANKWLSADPPQHLYAFLRLDFAQLKAKYRRVYGARLPHPRLIELKND